MEQVDTAKELYGKKEQKNMSRRKWRDEWDNDGKLKGWICRRGYIKWGINKMGRCKSMLRERTDFTGEYWEGIIR